MGVYKRGDTWWYEFVFAGKRVRESAKTTSKTIAKEAEKNRRRALERTLASQDHGRDLSCASGGSDRLCDSVS